MPINRGMDKDVVHINNGMLFSHKKKRKKERNNAICSSMNGPRDSHTQLSKSEKEKCMLSLILGIKKKKRYK